MRFYITTSTSKQLTSRQDEVVDKKPDSDDWLTTLTQQLQLKLKKLPPKSFTTSPKRPESDFNHKSTAEHLNTPRLEQPLKRSTFTPSENKTLCQQNAFMRRCANLPLLISY